MPEIAAPPRTADVTCAPATLTADQVASYHENGFLVVTGALQPEEIAQLHAETVRICRGERGALRNGLTHSAAESDEEVIRQYLCIHFPHKLSPLMDAQLSHPVIVDVLTRIIGPDVKCMQSMLFVKSAGKPGQAWHQDEDFIPTRDRSLTGAWMALDDATLENGCLWVLPGSQRQGVLWPLGEQDDRRFDCTDESHGFPWRDEDAIPVEVPGRVNRLLQRLPAAPFAAQPRPQRPPPRAGQPLHERAVVAALDGLRRGDPRRHRRLPRHRHGRRERPLRVEGRDGPRGAFGAPER